MVTDAVSKIIKAGASLYEGIVVGIVVVVAVAFSQVARKGQSRKQFFPGALGWTAALVLGLLGASLAAVFGGRWVALSVGVGIFALALTLKAYERDRFKSLANPTE
jgi:ribose transport system permease protein